MKQAFKSWLKKVSDQLLGIQDSPHKIAFGFGLGVFLGILPGAGPVASVTLAFIFRVNKAAALAGSVLTNTWLSFVTFALAVKLGAGLTGTEWQKVSVQCQELVKNFHFKNLFDAAILQILKPLMIGYLGVGLSAGILAYLLAYAVVGMKKKSNSGTGPEI